MIRYIIHLRSEFYEPGPKENKASAEAGQTKNDETAKKKFKADMAPYAVTKEVSFVKEEYTGPTFTTAIFIDIAEDFLEKIIDILRELDIVDIMEPKWEPWPTEKQAKSTNNKDITRFLK